jgi:hypothetical protein
MLSLRSSLLSLALACGCVYNVEEGSEEVETSPTFALAQVTKRNPFVQRRLTSPPGTIVYDRAGLWVATFTDGTSTVRLAGPERTFTEATSPAPIVTDVWVRSLDAPFTGVVDDRWLAQRMSDTSPDLLARAMEYLAGAPPKLDGQLQIAGDAHYGPLVDGVRQEGADFNDYLGIPWTYRDGTVDPNELGQLGSLDCSGFIRMIWGYRGTIPLARLGDLTGRGLPRRAVEMAAAAPGIMILPDTGVQQTELTKLRTGDIVFFDGSTDDGDAIDHVGMYLGQDTAGRYRFVSSRKSIDGPTFGDYNGASCLDGTGLYARTFRAARRL